jgi:hypothetical protein
VIINYLEAKKIFMQISQEEGIEMESFVELDEIFAPYLEDLKPFTSSYNKKRKTV